MSARRPDVPHGRPIRRVALAVVLGGAFPGVAAQTATAAASPPALLRFGVPRASVAVVQNGDAVYRNGPGVRGAGRTVAVDSETTFTLGLVTKSVPTMLAGTLVDDGRLSWETRLVNVLPALDPSSGERRHGRAMCRIVRSRNRDCPCPVCSFATP